MILDASTVTEEAISKGTAKKDPEETIGQETDIEMTEEEDREAEIDLHADLPEMTQDLWIEAETTGITVTAENMVTGTTTEEMIVTTEEEAAEVVAIEEEITLATSMKDPTTGTTDLGLELLPQEETKEEIDLPNKDLTDPTTGEIDPLKKVATLPFTTRNCPITTNNLRVTKTAVVSSRWNKSTLSQTGKFQRDLKLQLSKKLVLINPQLTRPKTSEEASSKSLEIY